MYTTAIYRVEAKIIRSTFLIQHSVHEAVVAEEAVEAVVALTEAVEEDFLETEAVEVEETEEGEADLELHEAEGDLEHQEEEVVLEEIEVGLEAVAGEHLVDGAEEAQDVAEVLLVEAEEDLEQERRFLLSHTDMLEFSLHEAKKMRW